MFKKRIISFILALSLLLISLCSCAKQETKDKYVNENIKNSVSSQSVAQNETYELIWNDEEKCVLLKNKTSGFIWSTIPYESLSAENRNVNLNSTLNISVVKEYSAAKTEIKGYSGAIEKGRILSEKIDGGIKITYCFDEQKVAVPVTYMLRDDSVCVTVDTKDILEAGEYKITSLSLLPNFTSATNSGEDSYLFVPSGSGALVYAKETVDGTKKFDGEMYGADEAELITARMSPLPKLYLPVFGAKDKDNALFAIIEKGSDSAIISLEGGNKRSGYSNIYPTFKIRGTDTVTPPTVNLTTDDLSLFSETSSDTVFSVGYYPLEGAEADYNGMAAKYRSYLKENGELLESAVAKSPYNISFYGGILSTKTTLGIPNKQLSALTTLKEVKAITEELSATMTPATVRLLGFGNNGVLPGKIAGGYSLPSVLGSAKEHNALEKYCKENNISLFTDYDLVRISESGSGFSASSSVAKSATRRKAVQYYKQVPLRQDNKDISYSLLGRDDIKKAVDKLIKYAKKENISGISLSTFGSMSYSDFEFDKYTCKSNMSIDVLDGLKSIKENGHKIASADANGYAAAYSDVIYDVPTDNGGYNALDESIPFYQMIFSGTKTLVSNSLNTSPNAQKQLMFAAQCGMGLGYSIIGNFDVSDLEINSDKFYAMLYDDNTSLIEKHLKQYRELYEAINGSTLISFEKVNSSISKSVFENGIIVFANCTSEKASYKEIILDGYGFVYLGGDG